MSGITQVRQGKFGTRKVNHLFSLSCIMKFIEPVEEIEDQRFINTYR